MESEQKFTEDDGPKYIIDEVTLDEMYAYGNITAYDLLKKIGDSEDKFKDDVKELVDSIGIYSSVRRDKTLYLELFYMINGDGLPTIIHLEEIDSDDYLDIYLDGRAI